MKTIVISGKTVELQEKSKAQMKGISVGDSISYRFYEGAFHSVPLLFAEPKGNIPTPRSLAITASELNGKFGLPVVFLLEECPAYKRQRLIDKDVYFIVSKKYAFLPMLVANERLRKRKPAKRLSPVAQYLLLYHLQIESLEGVAARDIEGKIPYSYPNITLGITCLADLELCQKISDGSKRKIFHFNERGRRLWEKAQPFLINPVADRVFCDEFLSEDSFPFCGINALAHYTRLNPDPERIIMMSADQLRSFKESGALVHPNEYDGNIIVEAWKYPLVVKLGEKSEWVDKLSLAISHCDNSDPRVEGEVERLIDEIKWKA